MKKTLILAGTLSMGMMASVQAANPFSDVPEGHWAYQAVANLTTANVIESYGNNFDGNKLMTRYEMAQIVANAMARGANCRKLQTEFADELETLGVKTAKLEKKMDNFKIAANIRYSYRDTKGNYTHPWNPNRRSSSKQSDHGTGYNELRTRIYLNGQINDNWSFTGMLEQNRFLDSANSGDSINLTRAWVAGRIGGLNVEAGRCYYFQRSMIDSEGDGAKIAYNLGGTNLTGMVMKSPVVLHHGWNKDQSDPVEDNDRFYMLKAERSFGKINTHIAYWKADCALDTEILDICVTVPIAKDFRLSGEYFHGNGKIDTLSRKSDKNGYEFRLDYKEARASIPGSFGLYSVYSNRPFSTCISQSAFGGYAGEPVGMTGEGDGYKGWELGADYTFAKNIIGGIKYFDYQNRNLSNGHARTLWTEVVFMF